MNSGSSVSICSADSTVAIECRDEILMDLEGEQGTLGATSCWCVCWGDMALFFDDGMAFSDCSLTGLD